MKANIENAVTRLCDWIDKHADECGPENEAFASVVASTAKLAQIAAGNKETAGGTAVKSLQDTIVTACNWVTSTFESQSYSENDVKALAGVLSGIAHLIDSTSRVRSQFRHK